ncbi:MAG TPA: c-type cytochrome, partial [Chryseolinea sp.]|nr:c-type cytochrome [Chryseolinea sp.]
LTAGMPPVVKLRLNNRSFYWDTIHYSFLVTDPVLVDLTHGSSGQFRSSIQVFDNDAIGLAIKPGQVNAGERMMHESDCQACHQMDAKSAGPSLRAISEKYRTDASAIDRLARKILTGGSGVWGAINMSAHPQLSMSQAQEIVRYIYSLTALDLPSSTIPPVGLIKTAAGGRKSRESDRLFKISGAYLSDRKEFKAFAYRDSVLLRNAVVQAGDFDQYSDAYASKGLVKGHSFSYVTLSKVDLSGIKTLKITASGPIELRADSHNGKLLGRSSVIEQRDLLQTTVQLTPVAGMHDIFIVFSVGKNGFILNEELKSVEFVK